MLGLYVLLSLIIPAIMILFGKVMMNTPPAKINSIYGYRTSRSKKSQAAWIFANMYFGKLWFYNGIIVALFSVAVMIFMSMKEYYSAEDVLAVLMYVQIAVLLLPIIPTEIELKKNFDKNGNPIQHN